MSSRLRSVTKYSIDWTTVDALEVVVFEDTEIWGGLLHSSG